jgi:hypothetical protein
MVDSSIYGIPTPGPPYATLTDTVLLTTIDFVMESDWKPRIHEEAGIFYPLGNQYPTKLTDGVKGTDGELTIVSTSYAMDNVIVAMRKTNNVQTLKIPTPAGTLSFDIMWDPATDMTGTTKFSQLLWQWVTVWSAKYFQVA